MSQDNLRVSIIGLHYAPESSGNAPYTTRLAERLVAQGHDVRVITGYPHYPEWKLAEGYSGWRRNEVINGVRIKRLRHFIPRRVTTLSRLHMELSFGVRLLLSRWGRPEVVIVVSPALFSTGFVCLRTRLGIRRPATGLWIQDLYSRGLEETGLGNSAAAKLMKLLEGLIVRSATKTAVIHQRFADYLVSTLDVPENKISVIRNWSHAESNGPLDRSALRRQYGWKNSEIIVLHAGNMGIKQGLENVVDAARLAASRGSRVRFVLLGDGNQRPRLQGLSDGVSNVQFMPPVSDDSFIPTLRSADVLLVNEMAGLREMSVPSKLTSYFATGQPVLAATDPNSTTANEIESANAGLVVPPTDPEALLAAAERLGNDTALSQRLGHAGMKFCQEHLSEAAAIRLYDSWVRELARN